MPGIIAGQSSTGSSAIRQDKYIQTMPTCRQPGDLAERQGNAGTGENPAGTVAPSETLRRERQPLAGPVIQTRPYQKQKTELN